MVLLKLTITPHFCIKTINILNFNVIEILLLFIIISGQSTSVGVLAVQ